MANYISSLTGQQMDVSLLDMANHTSEAWAVGERNGIPVAEGDVTYNNNARYWAEQAASLPVLTMFVTLTNGTADATFSQMRSAYTSGKSVFLRSGSAQYRCVFCSSSRMSFTRLNVNDTTLESADHAYFAGWICESDNTWTSFYHYFPYLPNGDTTFYVNGTSGNDSNDGSQASPFATIQHALDVIPKFLGETMVTINVAAGTYNEVVNIERFVGGLRQTVCGINIIGAGADVSGGDTSTRVDGFTITGNNCGVRLRGLYIAQPSNRAEGVIAYYTGNLVILNCLFDGSRNSATYTYGVRLQYGGVTCGIQDCTISQVRYGVSGGRGVTDVRNTTFTNVYNPIRSYDVNTGSYGVVNVRPNNTYTGASIEYFGARQINILDSNGDGNLVFRHY